MKCIIITVQEDSSGLMKMRLMNDNDTFGPTAYETRITEILERTLHDFLEHASALQRGLQ